jgi:hypothetical protein
LFELAKGVLQTWASISMGLVPLLLLRRAEACRAFSPALRRRADGPGEPSATGCDW